MNDTIDEILNDMDEQTSKEPELEQPVPEPDEPEPETPQDDPPPIPEMPKFSVGPFSLLGVVFLVLTILALVGTVVLFRYDTLISGADEETIGDTQWMYIYLAMGGTVLFAVLTIAEVLRKRRAREARA